MSTSTKTILWIILVVLVVLGVWWWFASQNAGTQNTVPPAAQSNSSAPAATNTQNQNQTIVSTGTSDASLDQDLANIDSQLGGLASDSAAVDTSLNQSTTAQ